MDIEDDWQSLLASLDGQPSNNLVPVALSQETLVDGCSESLTTQIRSPSSLLNYPQVDVENIQQANFPPEINILNTSKLKGQTYEYKDNILFTKKGTWVSLEVKGTAGSRLAVKVVYDNIQYSDKPVKSCLNCCPGDVRHFFLLDSHKADHAIINRYDLDGHHIAYADLHTSNTVRFNLKFNCWNSCSVHKDYGKRTKLRLTLSNERETVKELEIDLRSCAAPKRDIGIVENGVVDYTRGKKMKRETTENLSSHTNEMLPLREESFSSDIDTKPKIGALNTCHVQRLNVQMEMPLIAFQMNSLSDQDYITKLVERLGGVVFPVVMENSVQKFGIKDVLPNNPQ